MGVIPFMSSICFQSCSLLLRKIRKQSLRSCNPCCVAEANEDVTLIITPPISGSDILLYRLLAKKKMYGMISTILIRIIVQSYLALPVVSLHEDNLNLRLTRKQVTNNTIKTIFNFQCIFSTLFWSP